MKRIFKKPLGAVRTLGLFVALTTMSLNAQNIGTIQIGSGTTNTNGNGSGIPMTNYNYSYTQQLVTAAEYSANNGIAGNITKIRWMFPSIGTTTVYGDWDIWIGHTTKTAFDSATDWVPISDMQQVFSGNIHTDGTPGPTDDTWFEITFSTPFNYNGTDNIVVAVHEKTLGWSLAPSIRTYISSTNSGIVYRNDNINPNPASPPSASSRVSTLAQIQFEGILPTCLKPVDLAFTQNSVTSATLGWTSGGNSFDVEWGEAGFALGSGTQINGLTTNSVDITTVENTEYQFYVRQDCGGTDGVSLWQGPFNFKTGYCFSNLYNVGCANGAKIANFEINQSIVNLANDTGVTTCGTSGYNDFTSMSASSFQGGESSFVVQVGQYSAAVKIWVDWNGNGLFEDSELIANSGALISPNTNFKGVFTVPAGTQNGDYRLRVRAVESNLDFTACSAHNYGEVEDYTLTIVDAPSCIPPTSLTFTQNSVTSATLGWTSGGNLFDVEWGEAGFALGNGTLINGLTTNSVSVTTVENTDYQFYVRHDCGNSDTSLWSGPFNFKTFFCIPSYTSTTDYTTAFSTTVNGTTFANYSASSQTGTAGYNDLVGNTAYNTTALAGETINFSHEYEGGSNTVRIWVDWNNNELFEDSEQVFNGYTTEDTQTGSFVVPTNQEAGNYRMRMCSTYGTTIPGACNNIFYGQALDMTIVVVPCPTIAAPTGDENQTFTAGQTIADLVVDGTNLVWYSDSALTSAITTTTELENNTTYYVVSQSGICKSDSLAITTTINITYCTPSFSGDWGYINTFETIGGTTNINNITNAQSQNGYGDFTSQSVVITAGESFDFSATSQSTNGWAIWIDWNKDGIFDTDELLFNTTSYVGSISGTINVPMYALGTYRMRVLCSWGSFNPTDPCMVAGSGEVEDYTIDVQAMTPCAGTPNAGTVTVTPEEVSTGQTFDVKAIGYDTNSGLTFQWEKLPEGSTVWEEVGTSSSFYQHLIGEVAPFGFGTQVKYRLKVTCANSNETNYSNEAIFKVGYCITTTTSPAYYTSAFSTLTSGSTNINYTAGSQTGISGYNNLSADPTQKLTVIEGQTVNFTHTFVGGNNNIRIWIDWNNDGDLTDDEQVFYQWKDELTITGSFTIPIGTTPDNYRMRVRSSYSFSDPNDPLVIAACGSLTYGSTLDFTMEVEATTPCAGTPNAGTITVNPATANAGETFSVTATGSDINSGLIFQWERLPEGSTVWEEVGTATSEYQDLNGEIAPANIGDQIKYRLKVTCTNSNETSYSNEEIFETGKIYCVPNFSNEDYMAFIKDVITTGATTNINNTNTSYGLNGSGFSDYTAQQLVVTQGTDVNFTVNTGGDYEYLTIWVDFNNNGTFEASEVIFASADASDEHSGTFSTSSVMPGNYRMRVMIHYNATTNPCVSDTWGEAEDYTLVVNCPTIAMPTGETAQEFTAGQTIEDLVVNGDNLVFYNSTYSETFSLTDELVNGQTYYVVNEINGCQSDPLIINVTEIVSRSDFDVYGFRYHPNPVNDILYFTTNTAIENVVVSNMLGQQINANLSSDKTSLDMSNLPNGNYLVKVTIEGVSKTIKVIKN